MARSAFFTVHAELPREGPGEPEDVAWACDVAGIAATARICDVACGPGSDMPALRAAAPLGEVTGIDKMPHFVAQAQSHAGPGVTVRLGDMAHLGGPYDLIWCAGALYFLGVTQGLRQWRGALAPTGVVAFSEPCWFSEARSCPEFWEGYAAGTAAEIAARVRAAGYEVMATRRLSDAAWEAYYGPLEARAQALQRGADAALAAACGAALAEAALWRAHRDETGYLLVVARPA